MFRNQNTPNVALTGSSSHFYWQGRLRLLWSVLLGALLLSTTASAQPLERGVALGTGQRVVIGDGSLLLFDSAGSARRTTEGGPFRSVVQPLGWTDSFLVRSKFDWSRGSVDPSGALVLTELHTSPEAQLTVWNQSALLSSQSAPFLLHLTDREQQEIPVLSQPDLFLVDDDTALLRTESDWGLLRREHLPEVFPINVPKLAELSSCAVLDRRAFLWDQASPLVYSLEDNHLHFLTEPPKLGFSLVIGGGFLALSQDSMFCLRPDGQLLRGARPESFGALELEEAKLFYQGESLVAVYAKGDQVLGWRWSRDGELLEKPVAEGVLHALIPGIGPEEPAWLFLTSAVLEADYSPDGKPIVDLKTGESRTYSVGGHSVYRLNGEGNWELRSVEPRQTLVGPVERLGPIIVLAVQTEPTRALGQARRVEPKFPYPQVILAGFDPSNLDPVWKFEAPRGSTPAKSRLPDDHWPKFSPQGPMLLTSESGQLLSLDPNSGNLLWTSNPLPLDESSPLMLDWADTIGLVTVQGSTQTLFQVDPQDGGITGRTALNPLFFSSKWPHLLGVVIICLALLFYIYAAGRKTLYIRRIAGLQALDEAVGRATEMGKPVLYVTGLADVDDIQTLAALSIMSHVARKTAEYDTPIVATTSRAVTYSAAKEVVKDAFTIAGRPDAFSVDSVRYISDDQFGYTAGVDGIMLREKPAANFYMGKFYAESLILAETGHATGAIQIAGTAEPSQLPFFVAACDYTLIGEELFAASAYLSRDPLQVGSLRGQDVGKALVMVALLAGSIYVTAFGPFGGAAG